MRHHDSEEDHGQNQKKSVLAKVKEKAKKLRHSLSSKKRHEDGNSTSPSWGSGQEGDGAEEDAEYHGAPSNYKHHTKIYLFFLSFASASYNQINISVNESEKAPEGYQENARQHQRVSPIFPQKHVPGREPAREKTLSRSLSKKTTQTTIPTNVATATSSTFSGPMKILTKPVPEKNLTPACAEGSEPRTPHAITTKLQALALSRPAEHHNSSSTTAPSKTYKTSLSLGPSHTPSGLRTASAPNPMASPPPSPPSSAPSGGNSTNPTSQIWDKGVSVKEYLMNKFEPGEDEKALSSVISEAMSPKRTPGDVGVIEKVREAVTSLLRTGEPTKRADTDTTPTTRTSSQIPASTNTTPASSHIPVSSNTQEGNLPVHQSLPMFNSFT